MTDELERLKLQLQDALAEIEKLRKENARLKQTLSPTGSTSVIKPKVKAEQQLTVRLLYL
jgi:prefoldin subunit 5